MNGLFLQGGGAKGAFQAGVICGLYERGIDFNVISGTSIGAMNSYYVYTNNIDKLRDQWLNTYSEIQADVKYFGKVFENKEVIENLNMLDGKNESVKSLYVNYVRIEKSQLQEVIVDITKLDKNEGLDAIRYSSLLPLRMDKEMTMSEILTNFDSDRIFGEFQEDVFKGLYDGYNLDGGILNNNLLTPFINDKVDKLYLIVFEKGYKIPEYLLENYDKDNIIIIEPETELQQSDILRFEKEFCTDLFNEGYKISKKIKI